MEEKKLFTVQVFTENIAGVLNQITAVFTRRQVNIESLNVSASSIKGIHKYTITTETTEENIRKMVKQIEKKVDVVKAHYYLNSDLFMIESALFKLSTPAVMANPEVSRAIRHAEARITEVNSTFCIVCYSGISEDILNLFHKFEEVEGCLLQYTRSGRIAVTRSCEEKVNDYLLKRSLSSSENKS